MAKDLDSIYWLWNYLQGYRQEKPALVIAVQKEMFRGHFFFDKMQKIELVRLKTERMLQAYQNRFNTTGPFTEESLLLLASMSCGIFRRFLRYITLTLHKYEISGSTESITTDLVKAAVPIGRLAEDMEPELSEPFPKQSDLRYLAVQLILHLEQHGPQTQTQLCEVLDVKEYQLTRILQKLERHRYVNRERKGQEKSVTLLA